MEDDQILKYLAGKLDEDLEVVTNDMARGTAADFGSYKYAAGIIRGLHMAKNHIIETAERVEGADD